MAMTPLTKQSVPTMAGEQTGAAPGRGPLAAVRSHPLVTFFVLVFALTWLIQIPWVAGERGWLPFQVPVPLVLLQGWMPGLAALLVTGTLEGRAGGRARLPPLPLRPVRPWWYAVPIVGTAALWFGGLVVDPLL